MVETQLKYIKFDQLVKSCKNCIQAPTSIIVQREYTTRVRINSKSCRIDGQSGVREGRLLWG